jgi:hypothetical protein
MPAKKTSARNPSSPRTKELPPLTPIQGQVIAYVMTSIALEDYENCCTADRIAEQLQRDPEKFMQTLRKLEAKGYVRIEGETFPLVYPTIEALLQQDRRLSETDARKILALLK